MSDKSAIEWTDATWNPTRGCSLVSEGCRNCYAMHWAHRFSGPGQPYAGLVSESGKWNGNMRLVRPMLTKPFAWKRPRRIFVNSMSDLFHEGVIWDWLDEVFAVMYDCQWHTFQVLTKRPERMLEYLSRSRPIVRIAHKAWWLLQRRDTEKAKIVSPEDIAADLFQCWPLPNVHLGVSVEDQATADARIPHLLRTPAAVRFLSAEPLLGEIDLGLSIATCSCCNRWPSRWVHLPVEVRGDWPIGHTSRVAPGIYRAESNQHGALALRDAEGKLLGIKPGEFESLPGLDGVICGGESGPHARPMHPDWARSLRDQCQAAGAAFFFKQWGEWEPWQRQTNREQSPHDIVWLASDGATYGLEEAGTVAIRRVGKKAAGRLLDGREHSELPQVKP